MRAGRLAGSGFHHLAAFVIHIIPHPNSSGDARGRHRSMFNTVLAVLAVLAVLVARAVLKLVFLPLRLLRGLIRRRPAVATSR